MNHNGLDGGSFSHGCRSPPDRTTIVVARRCRPSCGQSMPVHDDAHRRLTRTPPVRSMQAGGNDTAAAWRPTAAFGIGSGPSQVALLGGWYWKAHGHTAIMYAFPNTRWSLIATLPGQPQQVGTLIAIYADAIGAYLHTRLVGEHAERVDDIVQEVLVDLLGKPEILAKAQPGQGNKFSYYLMNLAWLGALNALRHHRRRERAAPEAHGPDGDDVARVEQLGAGRRSRARAGRHGSGVGRGHHPRCLGGSPRPGQRWTLATGCGADPDAQSRRRTRAAGYRRRHATQNANCNYALFMPTFSTIFRHVSVSQYSRNDLDIKPGDTDLW